MARKRTYSTGGAPPTYPPQAPNHYYRAPVAGTPPEIWIQPPAPQPRRTGRLLLFIVGGLVVLFLAVMLAAAVGIAGLFYVSDLILPGTHVIGVNVGGQTTAEATATLQTHWQQRSIILVAGDTTQAVPPQALGMTLDAAATARLAYEQGRSPEAVRRGLRAGSLAVLPVWEIDLAAAEAGLRNLAPQFEKPAVNAGVHLVNGRMEVIPPVIGQALDVPATVTRLGQTAAQAVLTNRLELVTAPVTPAITNVDAIAEQANQLLATPLTIRGYDPVKNETVARSIPPDVWAGWLALDVDAGNPSGFKWVVAAPAAETYLGTQADFGAGRYLKPDEAVAAIAAAINNRQPEVTLRLYNHDRQHEVRPGETLSSIGRDYGIPYPWIQQANPGVGALAVGQVLTIPSPDVMLPLPVVQNKRVVVSISQQRMWAYENGGLKWEWPVSTGIDDSPTAPGVFQVQSHEPNAYAGNWDLWMPHFMGIYRPVPTSDFMNGFHGFPTRSGSQLLWTSSLGRKVTYGCILISSDNAILLYEWAEEGVVVEIQP